MKQIFGVTKEDIERRRAKLLEEHPEKRKLLKPKKANGSARNAMLKELLRTTAKVTKAKIDATGMSEHSNE